jgi:predicted flavoprotein YhiN
VAGQRGLKVLVLDHSDKIAEKIRISGGGRCNFTNRLLDASAPQKHFLGQNPQFCRSALSRYTPQDFIDLVQKHMVKWSEKEDSDLWNKRVDALIDLVKEIDGRDHEPKNGKG